MLSIKIRLFVVFFFFSIFVLAAGFIGCVVQNEILWSLVMIAKFFDSRFGIVCVCLMV